MINSSTLFSAISIILVISSCLVIFATHPVFSLLFLVVSFIFAGFFLFLLECEFLALLFLIIYVGAIIILFLFSIMLLETKLNNVIKNSTFYFPIGIIFSLFLLTPLFFEVSYYYDIKSVYILESLYFNVYQNWFELIDGINDMKTYGLILYNYYVFQFLISGIILLLVLVGIISLTNVFKIQNSLEQSLFKQLSRNFKYIINK